MKSPLDRQRRQLLKSLSALPLMSGVSLSASNAHAMECPTGTGRSLVCVFLAGGADSFNLFVPGGARYDDYRATRNELAADEGSLLGVSDAAQGSFGFNAAVPALADLYREQRLAVVSNVGPLIRPTERSDYLGSIALPQSLFAHNTQQKLWLTGAGTVTGSDAFGWGGSVADHAAECNGNNAVSPAFSIAGSSDWLASTGSRYVSLNADVAVQQMFGYDNISDWIPPQRLSGIGRSLDALIALGEDSRNPLLTRAISQSVGRANQATASLWDALRANPLEQMQYDNRNKLARQLHLVARLIASRDALGMRSQVFFVKMGGWDTHSNQAERLPQQMQQLNEAIGAFQGTLDGLSLADSVTSFTASDFGRTLTSNGNGTDHGWGGHGFVFGGAVSGGRIIGETPSYASRDNPDDAGEPDGSFAGRIIPRLSVNQYAASLSRWMGVSEARIDAALPDLVNFAERDLGLFSA